MVYLLEHKDKDNNPKSSAFVSAFFDAHARDIYEFIVDIKEEDTVNITEVGEGITDLTVYVEINRFDEFVGFSRKPKTPAKGGTVKEFVINDSITDVEIITNNIGKL